MKPRFFFLRFFGKYITFCILKGISVEKIRCTTPLKIFRPLTLNTFIILLYFSRDSVLCQPWDIVWKPFQIWLYYVLNLTDQVRPFVQNNFPVISQLIWVRTKKIFFLFLSQNICCGYSKEPSQGDCSIEHPKHMLRIMGKKIFTILRRKFVFI